MNTDEFLSLFYRLPIKTNTKTAEHVVSLGRQVEL